MPLGGIVFCFGFFMFLMGVIGMLSKNQQRGGMPYPARSYTTPARAQQAFAASARPAQQPARVLPTVEQTSTGAQSILQDGFTMATGIRGDFERARIGQNITVNHPQRGTITGKILGTIR